MFGIFGQVLGAILGKHKRIVGSAGLVVGGILDAAGIPAGHMVKDVSMAVLGVGMVHAAKKERDARVTQ